MPNTLIITKDPPCTTSAGNECGSPGRKPKRRTKGESEEHQHTTHSSIAYRVPRPPGAVHRRRGSNYQQVKKKDWQKQNEYETETNAQPPSPPPSTFPDLKRLTVPLRGAALPVPSSPPLSLPSRPASSSREPWIVPRTVTLGDAVVGRNLWKETLKNQVLLFIDFCIETCHTRFRDKALLVAPASSREVGAKTKGKSSLAYSYNKTRNYDWQRHLTNYI